MEHGLCFALQYSQDSTAIGMSWSSWCPKKRHKYGSFSFCVIVCSSTFAGTFEGRPGQQSVCGSALRDFDIFCRENNKTGVNWVCNLPLFANKCMVDLKCPYYSINSLILYFVQQYGLVEKDWKISPCCKPVFC